MDDGDDVDVDAIVDGDVMMLSSWSSPPCLSLSLVIEGERHVVYTQRSI
jgi:hypothetical protein